MWRWDFTLNKQRVADGGKHEPQPNGESFPFRNRQGNEFGIVRDSDMVGAGGYKESTSTRAPGSLILR